MIEKRDFYINGAWVAPSQANDRTVINPSTEEPFAVISLGSQADTDAAVDAARAALPDWRATSPQERIALLQNLHDIHMRRLDEMAEMISMQMGAPIDWARNEQAPCGTNNILDAINSARSFEYQRPLNDRGAMILLEPIGVVGMITPWNWPISQVTLKVAPALAVGCTMVLKPSEYAPLDAIMLAEMIDEAGFPPGVFNLVNGDGAGVGTRLSAHPDVDMISFTGSTRAGKAILKNAADTFKRVRTELGGKGANVVFADAGLKAVKTGVRRCMNNTGQSCNAPTRMLVERGLYDEAVVVAKEAAESRGVDLASKSGNHIGPLVNAVQFDKVQGLIHTGIEEGATVVTGGTGRPEGFNRGYFVRPTIFADVTPNMTVFKEEIFGPVLTMTPFDSDDEALELANDTPYGLTDYVQTKDPERRNRFAKELGAGMVEMNYRGRGKGAPFGGVGASGDAREGGVWGLEEYLIVKSVSDWAMA